MNKKWMTWAGLLLTVGLVVLSLAVPTLAQDTVTPTTPAEKARGSSSKGPGMWFDRESWTTFDVVAETLGMTPTELFTELHAGKSVSEIAEAKGIDLQKVQDAVEAARLAARKAEIEQAVKDGTLTREQADWMLKGLEQGWMPMGRGGRGHGMGGRGASPSDSAPSGSGTTVTPSSSSL